MNQEEFQKLSLENDIKIMKFLIFGFVGMNTDGILTEGLQKQMDKIRESLNPTKQEKDYEDSI